MTEPGRLPDQAARDVIEQALGRNLLVEAGAGSGKTESLARRMAAGIAEGVYEIEGMAAVTFTRKAAAELRGRFQLELERRLAEETDGVRKARIAMALRHLERLFASTIHAFCAHLLRERPVEAGVAPGFIEQDEVEDVLFRRRAWRDYLDRERARGSVTLSELEACGIKATDLDDAFHRVCTFSDVAFPPGEGKMPDSAAPRAALEKFWRTLQAELPPYESATTCKLQSAADEFRNLHRVLSSSRPAVLAELLGFWLSKKKVVQKWWPGSAADRKATRDRLDALLDAFRTTTVQPFVAAWRQHCYRLAITLLVEGREFAQEARRRAGALNYGDLLGLAARLLRDDLAVRADLQAKYRWLFVDEFQDTNPLQAEVVLLLAAQPGTERDWRRVMLRSGALFVVGDPKQSIYRFTGADIETYDRVRRVIESSGGRVVELTTSFRAVPPLCDWVNAVFGGSTFFPATARPEQPVFHPLQPVRIAAHRAPVLKTLVIPETVEDRAAVVAFEAEAIARYIRDEVGHTRRHWGDFLVLTRFKKHLPIYAAALDALQIPSVVSGTATFAASRTVAGLADLLRALADPDDGVTLVGVLRGPLFGISDDLLFRHRQCGWPFMLTAPLPDDASGPVAEALGALRAMYRHTRTLPVPAALGRIVESTGLLARAAAMTPGGAEAGDLLHAIDRVRRITEDAGTLAEAADALEQDLESSEVESVALEPGREDVVRVMNLHKVKGLEAAVVFLVDPLGDRAPRAEIRVMREGPQALGYFPMTRAKGKGVDVLAEPAGWAGHAAAELRFVEAERSRLLYVAATRAKDMLVVSQHAGADKGSWHPFTPHLTAALPLRVPAPAPLDLRGLAEVSAAIREAAAARRQAALVSAREPSWSVESVTGTAHHAGPPGHPLAPGRTREPDTGMAWGTLVHGLLEHAMRGPHRDRAHLQRLATWLTVDKPALRRVVPEALDTVERVMASDLWLRAQAAGECLAEVPFAVGSDGEGAPRVLYGVIDLAFRTPEGWHIVDYKTDQAALTVLTERYAAQVRAYAGPWARLMDERIAYAGLFAVRAASLSANLVVKPPESGTA